MPDGLEAAIDGVGNVLGSSAESAMVTSCSRGSREAGSVRYAMASLTSTALPAALAKPESDRPAAWICGGSACQPPVTELAAVQLVRLLDRRHHAQGPAGLLADALQRLVGRRLHHDHPMCDRQVDR